MRIRRNHLAPAAIIAVISMSPAYVSAQSVNDSVAFLWAGVEDGATTTAADKLNAVVCTDKWIRLRDGEFSTRQVQCDESRVDDSRFTRLMVTRINRCKFFIEDEAVKHGTFSTTGNPYRVTDRIVLDFSRIRPWTKSAIPLSGLQPTLLGARSLCMGASCMDRECVVDADRCHDSIRTRFVARTPDSLRRWEGALAQIQASCPGLRF